MKTRDELPEFCKERGYKLGAEIGVYAGEYMEKFCQLGIKMHGIDPWLAYSGMGRTFQKQRKMDKVYQKAKERLDKYDCAYIIKKNSMEALRDFKDESLDFVYIDGNHSFKYIAEDLCGWAKKVRPGGMVSGHDYWCSSARAENVVCHVGPVVDAYVRVFGIDKLHVFGKGKDKYPSWMWIKR